MSRGTLHPVNGKRRKNWLKTGLNFQRTGYFAASREWRPRNYWSRQFGGWKRPTRTSVLSLLGKKRFVLGIVLIACIVGSNIVLGNVFHPPAFSHQVFQTGPDPTVIVGTRLFHILEPTGDFAEWNTFTPSGGDVSIQNCASVYETNSKCVQLGANSTFSAVAVTKSAFSLSSAASNMLAIFQAWNVATGGERLTTGASFGFYLTTNATIPTTAGYDPNNDKSVFLSVTNFCAANCSARNETIASELRMLRNVGDTMNAETAGCGPNAGALYLCNTETYPINLAFPFNPVLVENDMFLNYTGFTNTSSGANCSTTPVISGSACSFYQNWSPTPSNNGVVSTTFLSPFKIQAHEFYFGLYSRNTNLIQFGTDNNNDDYCCGIKSVNLAEIGQGITTAGFFQPLVDAIVATGVFIFTAFLKFIAFIAPALITALTFLESTIQAVLNSVGQAFGFPSSPGLGDDIFNFISSVITLFTVQVPNAFGQIGPIFTGWTNTLVIIFTTGIIGQIFSFLSSVLTFGVNIASFAFGVFTTGLNWTTIFVPFWLMIWFFGYNADEGMNGWIRWFEFVKWLAFDIGVKNVTWVINWTIDVITAAMAILPKPFVQMAGKFPRIPIIDIHGAFSVPDFDGQYLKEGNLFAILGMLGGFMGFVWYELTQTGIPGTLANEYPTQAWVTTAGTAITFYKLFLPMAVLVVFLLMVPTLFTSIFGVRATGAMAMPVSFKTHRRSPVSHGRSGGKLFRASQPGKRTQAFIKGRLEKIEGREREETKMRNAREQARKEEAKIEAEARAEAAKQQQGREQVIAPVARPQQGESDDQRRIREAERFRREQALRGDPGV